MQPSHRKESVVVVVTGVEQCAVRAVRNARVSSGVVVVRCSLPVADGINLNYQVVHLLGCSNVALIAPGPRC